MFAKHLSTALILTAAAGFVFAPGCGRRKSSSGGGGSVALVAAAASQTPGTNGNTTGGSTNLGGGTGTPSTPGVPQPVAAEFIDINLNRQVDSGDGIAVEFSEPVIIQGLKATDFELPVQGSSLGAGAQVAQQTQSRFVVITLGSQPFVNVVGTFSATVLASGSPSGIGLKAGTPAQSVTSVSGTPAKTGLAVDIDDHPTPVVAVYSDNDQSGSASSGDRVFVVFDRQVTAQNPKPSDFFLPVNGDTFGAGATVTAFSSPSLDVEIVLGSAPVLTHAGLFHPQRVVPGSASGVALVNAGVFKATDGTSAKAVAEVDVVDVPTAISGPNGSMGNIPLPGTGAQMGQTPVVTFPGTTGGTTNQPGSGTTTPPGGTTTPPGGTTTPPGGTTTPPGGTTTPPGGTTTPPGGNGNLPGGGTGGNGSLPGGNPSTPSNPLPGLVGLASVLPGFTGGMTTSIFVTSAAPTSVKFGERFEITWKISGYDAPKRTMVLLDTKPHSDSEWKKGPAAGYQSGVELKGFKSEYLNGFVAPSAPVTFWYVCYAEVGGTVYITGQRYFTVK